MSKMNTAIEAMGYLESKNYFMYEDIVNSEVFDFHWTKVLSLIKPDAVYIIDKSPFILFFSNEKVMDFKTIWNAQIPFVFVLTEDTIYVYNGKKWIHDQEMLVELERRILEDVELINYSYWNLNNESFLTKHKKELFENQLDAYLLQNLKTLTRKLMNDFEVRFATKLVLRIIFIRFLIDRGVNLGYGNFGSGIEESQTEFLKILKTKEDLYGLFKYLKQKFNGNLFELSDEEDWDVLKSGVFELLKDFISGDLVLDDGQRSLFSMYDFNIISVELISNIYEILLGSEGQKENKSFYTPSYLVDYILSKTVEIGLKESDACKVFDPSCGSGIFLVKSYRKMIEKQLKSCGLHATGEILIDELKNNIYGVDLNREAIDVTIFSLYLTMLDYKDPKDLENFQLPDLLNTNIFVSDFLEDDSKEKLPYNDFDFILGNPPWGGKKGVTQDISRDFVFKLSDYLAEGSVCSLILPSKLFYNHKSYAKEFREFLLAENILKEILDLSPVRKEIFKNAVAPAAIVIYEKSNEQSNNTLKNKFTHISLKPNIYFELFNILVIEKNDLKFVEQDLVYRNDWAWKVLLYGSSWDLDICYKLREKYKTIKDVIEEVNDSRDGNNEKILIGAGIEMNNGKNDSSSYIGRLMLDSKTGLDRFAVNLETATSFKEPNVHRPRNPKLFEGSRCLVKKGLDMKNYRLKSAYSEQNFLFRETIKAIKGTKKDEVFLKAITGVFNSSISSYINVLLGTSVGIEREQVFLKEIIEFPYFDNKGCIEKVANLVSKIQDIESKKDFLINSSLDHDRKILLKELDDTILEAFELKGNLFVDYILSVQIPMICREKQQIGNKKTTETQLSEYAKKFQDYFMNAYSPYGYGIEIEISMSIANQFVAFELNINEHSNENSIKFIKGNNQDEKEMISRFSVRAHTDSFFTIKDSIVFADTSFYILKKDLFKNWHPAMAKRDLAEVLDRILTGGEG